jgi:dTDP-4-dehydrorhamnose reductase
VDWCEQHADQATKMNTDLPVRLAQLALELGARFIHISTDAVFDGKRMNYTVVARVNIYGWNAQNKQSLAEWILSQLATGKPVPGFTDVYFTPILVNDLAEILFAVLDRGLSGLYHIGASERISKYEFARRVAVEFGCNPNQVVPTSVNGAGLQAKRARDMSMNTEKISAALGRPMPNIESGLRRFRELRDTGYPQRLKSYLHGAQG